jgi:uncharacterized membrane protein YqhA
MFNRILSSSRYLVLIAVLGSFLAFIALLIYGGIETVKTIIDVAIAADFSTKGVKGLILSAVQIVDLFLLATALYLISLGLYELFIDDTIPVPKWLAIHNLDDLKEKLVSVIIIVMSVLFLGKLVDWDGKSDLLNPGAGIALMIAALTYFLGQKKKGKLYDEK